MKYILGKYSNLGLHELITFNYNTLTFHENCAFIRLTILSWHLLVFNIFDSYDKSTCLSVCQPVLKSQNPYDGTHSFNFLKLKSSHTLFYLCSSFACATSHFCREMNLLHIPNKEINKVDNDLVVSKLLNLI